MKNETGRMRRSPGRTLGRGALRLALPMLLASAAACTNVAVDYQLASVTPAPRRLPTGVPAVTAAVEAARQGAGPLPANIARVTDAWSTATIDAIRRSGLFVPTAPSGLEIAILIQGLSDDGVAAAAARYVVRRGPNGPVLLDTTILTDGTTGIDFSATGDGRRDAGNNAVRQNILRFLGALESLDPARVPAG